MYSSVIVLPSALTTPVVIEPTRPYGFPMAITGSPTLNVEELTTSSGVNSSSGASTSSTAKSAYGSVPFTAAAYPFPFENVTLKLVVP